VTLRRAFPRALRLVLTLIAVLAVGFYGAARSARQQPSWRFAHLPVFVNRAPIDVRDRALGALRLAGGTDDAARAAQRELVRLGGAALPHVLPRMDSLEPVARGRVAQALGAVARRMRIATVEDVATPEAALLFWTRFWQDRSIEFRPSIARRAVQRLAERSLTLRREDVLHADTYALEELVAALGPVESQADVERVRRLHPALTHITGRAKSLPTSPSLEEARATVEDWHLFWLAEGSGFVVLEGPRRIAAWVTETQFGKWFAHAAKWRMGRALDGTRVAPRALAGVPISALHVLALLTLGILVSAASALLMGRQDWVGRARVRVALAAASLVASYPIVLTLALAFELLTDRAGVLRLCAEGLRQGDVNLAMGALLLLTVMSELLVALPISLAAELGAAPKLGAAAKREVA
jgi:peptide/nickel transport system permease protein